MEWLNYHHLLYFWMVAREGSIARACGSLLLSQPTISGQLRALERAVGAKLFERVGRGLVLTETGREVFRYADEIFALGRELQDMLRDRPNGRPLRLIVGIVDVMPKRVVHRLLEPVFEVERALIVVVQRDPVSDQQRPVQFPVGRLCPRCLCSHRAAPCCPSEEAA